jgi:mono/diheme cytochrome c family protein
MMKRRLIKGLLAVVGLSLCALLMGAAASPDTTPPPPGKTTFYKDVLPILQNNCQSCHRPGEVAPMSLLTYEDAHQSAVAIKMAVLTKKMPPWYADPQYGHFSNERKLTPQQIKTLVTWVDGGTKPGDPKDAPEPVKFVDGWNIGVPDRVLEMPTAFNVPAEGTVDYQYMVISGGFTEDTWVRAAEVRPGNRALLHHVVVFTRPPDSNWMRGAKPGEFFAPKPQKRESTKQEPPKQEAEKKEEPGHDHPATTRRGAIGELLVVYTPGMQPLKIPNQNEAKLIKAGSDLVLQLHYTTNGIAGADKTKVGLVFAKQPLPKLSNVALAAANAGFRIPPNDDNYEVKSQVQLEDTVTLTTLWPHMHFRGKDFLYRVIYPDGKTETLLSVPKYDFNWQLEYRLAEPLVLPKGTRIECTAHFDNSVNNPYNPDPSKEVRWGDQTWEEMMMGWFYVSVDPSVDAAGLFKVEKPGTRTPPGQPDIKQLDAKPAGAAPGSAGSSQKQ